MEKSNKGLYILLCVLIALLLILSGYIIYDKVLSKNDMDNPVENNDVDNIVGNSNLIQYEDVNQTQYIRDTKVILYDEQCHGDGVKLEVQIDDNTKNIAIMQGLGAFEIKVGNAKYLYNASVIACDNYNLYYITENNELYLFDKPITDSSIARKVTDSSVVEFLGHEFKENDGEYLKVLLLDGRVEYIKYWSVPN